jgi:energy-converting hydrogenase Eha subunit B
MQMLFFESPVTRAVVATLVLCLPVYFAGLIFISSFSRAHFLGSALGSNLFGSLAGGLLESLSLWFGLKSLTIIAILLYAGSLITLSRQRIHEDSPVLETSATV